MEAMATATATAIVAVRHYHATHVFDIVFERKNYNCFVKALEF